MHLKLREGDGRRLAAGFGRFAGHVIGLSGYLVTTYSDIAMGVYHGLFGRTASDTNCLVVGNKLERMKL
jgi:hypothetical protein